MSYVLTCPNCGPREVTDFSFGGEVNPRPKAAPSPRELGGRRLSNYLRTMVLEAQTIARACGKSHVHNLEPEDLVALTIEAAAMARVPLAGTGWVPGPSG